MQNIHRKSFEFHVAIKWNGLPEGIKLYPQIQHLNMLLKFATRILFYYVCSFYYYLHHLLLNVISILALTTINGRELCKNINF